MESPAAKPKLPLRTGNPTRPGPSQTGAQLFLPEPPHPSIVILPGLLSLPLSLARQFACELHAACITWTHPSSPPGFAPPCTELRPPLLCPVADQLRVVTRLPSSPFPPANLTASRLERHISGVVLPIRLPIFFVAWRLLLLPYTFGCDFTNSYDITQCHDLAIRGGTAGNTCTLLQITVFCMLRVKLQHIRRLVSAVTDSVHKQNHGATTHQVPGALAA